MKIVITLIIVGVVVLAGGVVFFGPAIAKLSGKSTVEGLQVRLETVQIRSLVEAVRAPGRIEPYTNVEITSRIGSEITELPFREGDTVNANDIVVRLDDRDLKARLAGSQAALDSAKASVAAAQSSRDRSEAALNEQLARRGGFVSNLDFAQRALVRKQELYDTGDIPLTELEAAQERVQDIKTQIAAADMMISGAENSLSSADANVLQAQAAVKQAEADIQFAEQGLENTIIKSPITGRVTALNAEVGETVVPGAMNQAAFIILTIADLSRMKMIAEVAESDVTKVQPGQAANVYTIAHGRDRAFRGVVDRVSLQRFASGDGSGFFETEIALEHIEGELLSGYIANAEIEITEHEGLVVPSQAIVDRDMDSIPNDVVESSSVVDESKRVVRVSYRVIDGKAVATPVRIGASDETHTIVLEGLSEGDTVIIGPYKVLDTIKHGTSVRSDAAQPPTDGAETDESGPKV